MAMRTGIPVVIGKDLLILVTDGEEVIGDVTRVMAKYGSLAAGEDDHAPWCFT
jgi:hypothetical protein